MISKGAAGYQFHSDVDYTCGSCVFAKATGPDGKESGCALMAPTERINPDRGGSTMYAHFDPSRPATIPWIPVFTKGEIAYEENRNGFGCRRCRHFNARKNDCDEVDKDSPGDTPGEIHPYACCNVWDADRVRGQMTNAELVKILEKPRVTLRTSR